MNCPKCHATMYPRTRTIVSGNYSREIDTGTMKCESCGNVTKREKHKRAGRM